MGINLTGEITSSSDFVIGVGGTFEKQFKKHFGFETGLYYRAFELNGEVRTETYVYGYNIKEEYLSVPVLYKFNSSLLNFSVGPTFDIYLGWKQTNKNYVSYRLDKYDVNKKFIVGLMGKISKSIDLTPKILLEPEIRYNPIFLNQRSFYGIGMAIKYKLVN